MIHPQIDVKTSIKLPQKLLDSYIFKKVSGFIVIGGYNRTELMGSMIYHYLHHNIVKRILLLEKTNRFRSSSFPSNLNIITMQSESKDELDKHIQTAFRTNQNIICIEEINNNENIPDILLACQTGHAVLTTMPTTGISNILNYLLPLEMHELLEFLDVFNGCISQYECFDEFNRPFILNEYFIMSDDDKTNLIDKNLKTSLGSINNQSFNKEFIIKNIEALIKINKTTFKDDLEEKYNQGVISKNIFDFYDDRLNDTAR